MNYRKYTPFILIGFVSIVLNLFLHWVGVFSLVETKLYDYRFKLRGPIPEVREKKSDVVLVEIDDESYKLIPESYPYPRGSVWSNVIRNLTDADAKVIVFDIMFDSYDHSSKILEKFLKDDCSNCNVYDEDELFNESIKYANSKGTNVVLASKIAHDLNRIPSDFIVEPNDKIMTSLIKTGIVNQEADNIDYVIKRYPIFYKLSSKPDDLYLSLAVQSALSYYNLEEYKVNQDVDNSIFQIGGIPISTFGKEASFLINYYGPTSSLFNTFKTYPLYQIIDSKSYNLSDFKEDDDWMDKYIDPSSIYYSKFGFKKNPFKNKIVIIGSSLEEDNDFVLTPYFNYKNTKSLMPGLELHANAIQQILDKDYLNVPLSSLKLIDKSFIMQFLILFSLTGFSLFICNRKSIILSISLLLISVLFWFSFSMGLFINDQLWIFKSIFNSIFGLNLKFNYIPVNGSILIPVFYPIASMMITFGTNLAYRFFIEQKDKNFLKYTFGKYVSPDLINEMYISKTLPKLGGESGVRTAFFSDIESFSTIAEKMTSSELVQLLNDFLSSQTEIILNHKGTLDKYEGDAILAFYGAPVFFKGHAKAALDSGIMLQKNLSALREKWKNDEKNWPDIVYDMKMRIGINSGEMVTGNMGSQFHMNYTMMGDVVNIAARLESAAKQYGIYFHTTESTLIEAGEKNYLWRFLDRIQFVGKTVWYQTVEIIDYKHNKDDKILKLINNFHKGLDCYYNQDWDKALNYFKESNKYETNNKKNDINPSRVYVDRILEFKQFPPRKGWRGAFVLKEK